MPPFGPCTPQRRDDADIRRPPIVLSARDHARLQAIALNALLDNPRVAGPLLEEIDRAEILPDGVTVLDRVCLGAWVKYREAESHAIRTVRIVETEEHTDDRALWVLSPLGVALIGMAAGQSIVASDHRGSEQLLTVLSVEAPRDRASPGARVRRPSNLSFPQLRSRWRPQ
jgi:regulator of nucleoside diphosphate kinase